MSIPVSRLIENIRSKLGVDPSPLLVYWVEISGSRTQYRQQCLEARAELPIVPIIVRDVLFTHSNAIMSDLRSVIEGNRNEFEEIFHQAHSSQRVVILLLSLTQLSLPQISSPATAPEWFPLVGGTTVYVTIEDITRKIDAPLNTVEACVPEICELLFVLEGVLVRRLRYCHSNDHNSVNAFFDLIRSGPNEKFIEFLTSAEEFRGTIRSASGFRPSAREAKSLTARMLRVANSSSPDKLQSAAKTLVSALGLTNEAVKQVSESISALLLRPTNRDPNEAVHFTRNLLTTIFTAAQFVTAAAHADSYPRYPLGLIRSVSYDLRCTLRSLETALDALAS